MGIGNKPKKVILIEKMVSVATVTNCIVCVLSIFLVKEFLIKEIRILGIIIGIIAVIFFAMATITMKTSWRVGIQEEKHMSKMFGKEYDEYKKHTARYIGKK